MHALLNAFHTGHRQQQKPYKSTLKVHHNNEPIVVPCSSLDGDYSVGGQLATNANLKLSQSMQFGSAVSRGQEQIVLGLAPLLNNHQSCQDFKGSDLMPKAVMTQLRNVQPASLTPRPPDVTNMITRGDKSSSHSSCGNDSTEELPMSRVTTAQPKSLNTRVQKRYVDELGFYRSNKQIDDYDQYYRSIRRDLRISHFDRTHDYDQWKYSWDTFIKNKLIRNEPVSLNNELKIRLRSGIPQDYRLKMWTALINMRVKSIRERFGHNLYSDLISDCINDCEPKQLDLPPSSLAPLQPPKAPSGSNKFIQTKGLSTSRQNHPTTAATITTAIGFAGTSKWVNLDKCSKQIELDLLRTLPNNKHFDRPDSRGVQRVRRVLRAYAKFNPNVGYCQGMNRLAAVALLILPEEDAFWCMVAIIECIMPKDYYVKPWLAQVDCCALNDLLASKMPALHKHLLENDIDLTLFTWFFTVFVDGFKPELTLRVWDCFLMEGDKVLFRFALALVHIAQAKLMNMDDFSMMNNYLHQLGSGNDLDIEHLFRRRYNLDANTTTKELRPPLSSNQPDYTSMCDYKFMDSAIFNDAQQRAPCHYFHRDKHSLCTK